MTVSILIVDDFPVFRESMRYFLKIYADFEIAGEASNGREALELVASTRPDIILMDLLMPEMDGLQATGEIISRYPDCKIIILSMHSDEAYVKKARQQGVCGFILKEEIFSHVRKAIYAVLAGNTYYSPGLKISDSSQGKEPPTAA
jgi:DNA-binding NarL/FixJ family response regulator